MYVIEVGMVVDTEMILVGLVAHLLIVAWVARLQWVVTPLQACTEMTEDSILAMIRTQGRHVFNFYMVCYSQQ